MGFCFFNARHNEKDAKIGGWSRKPIFILSFSSGSSRLPGSHLSLSLSICKNHSSLSRACGRLTVPRSSLSRVVARRSLAHLSLARFSSLPITHHTGPSPSRSRHSLSPSCNLLRRPISEAAPLSSLSALHLLVGLLTGIVGESGLDGIVYSEVCKPRLP